MIPHFLGDYLLKTNLMRETQHDKDRREHEREVQHLLSGAAGHMTALDVGIGLWCVPNTTGTSMHFACVADGTCTCGRGGATGRTVCTHLEAAARCALRPGTTTATVVAAATAATTSGDAVVPAAATAAGMSAAAGGTSGQAAAGGSSEVAAAVDSVSLQAFLALCSSAAERISEKGMLLPSQSGHDSCSVPSLITRHASAAQKCDTVAVVGRAVDGTWECNCMVFTQCSCCCHVVARAARHARHRGDASAERMAAQALAPAVTATTVQQFPASKLGRLAAAALAASAEAADRGGLKSKADMAQLANEEVHSLRERVSTLRNAHVMQKPAAEPPALPDVNSLLRVLDPEAAALYAKAGPQRQAEMIDFMRGWKAQFAQDAVQEDAQQQQGRQPPATTATVATALTTANMQPTQPPPTALDSGAQQPEELAPIDDNHYQLRHNRQPWQRLEVPIQHGRRRRRSPNGEESSDGDEQDLVPARAGGGRKKRRVRVGQR